MSYKEREITVEFTLANGTFDGKKGNTLIAEGFKCELSVSAGGATGTMMELSLWGLSLDNMAKLTTNSEKFAVSSKTPYGFTGDVCVFMGTIISARVNLNQMPDAPIEITASAIGKEKLVVCEPTSIEGEASVADMIKALASKVDLKFVNVDVKSVHSNPYYEGNAIEQIQKIAADHNIIADIDFGRLQSTRGKPY
jgi:hypothetical protein